MSTSPAIDIDYISRRPLIAGPGGRPVLEDLSRRLLAALISGKRKDASQLITEAVAQGTPVRDIYLGVFEPVQHEVGRLWQENRISVAHEHFCTASIQLIMSQLYPYIFNHTARGRTMVGCCVGRELHEIGIRMVCDFFEMDGWDTYYMGANTPTQAVADAVAENNAHMLCISVTMSFNVHLARDLIADVRAITPDLIILVGGAPFILSPDLCTSIGADGTAVDAHQAVERGNRLVDNAMYISA